MLHHSLFSNCKRLILFAFAFSSISSWAEDFCPHNFKPFSNTAVISKLRLVYVTKPTSYDCKELTRDLLNNTQVNATLRHSFECSWLNADTPVAKEFIKKYKLKKFPAIVLIDDDGAKLYYNCDIGMESRLLLDQAAFFQSAVSISKQVAYLMKMNNLSRKDAQLKLARAYVANDIRKKQAGDKHYYAHKYTLGMKSLAVFQREYILDWERRSVLSKTGE